MHATCCGRLLFQYSNSTFLTHINNSNNNSNSSFVIDTRLFEGGNPLIPSDEEFDVLKRRHFAAIVITLCVVITCVGTLGNSLVFVTVSTTKRLRTATNIFIANLAVADVFVCAFDLPLNLYYILTDDWVYGKILCHVIPACYGIVVYASTLSLTMIAFDRFLLIVFPTRSRISPSAALTLVFLIAVMSVTVASPMVIYSKYDELNFPDINFHRRYCIELWPSQNIRKFYTLVTFFLQFFLPVLVIAVLYALVFRRVRSSRNQTRTVHRTTHRKSKTNRMLIAVVSVFVISWIPYQLYSLLSEFNSNAVYSIYYKFADLLLRMFAMSSSCVNPFLYAWLNDNFRSAFLGLIGRRRTLANERGGTRGVSRWEESIAGGFNNSTPAELVMLNRERRCIIDVGPSTACRVGLAVERTKQVEVMIETSLQ